MRAIALVCEYLALDEHVQVNGMMGLEDMTGFSMGHILGLWTNDVNEVWIKFFDKSLPTRFKGFHIYKEPPFMDTVMAIFKPLLPKKWMERLKLHGKSLVKVYEYFDKGCLPDEYLPDDYEGPRSGSFEQCCEAMIADMNRPEVRDYLLKLTSPEYGVNLSLKTTDDLPAASFRKIHVE